ncbi:3-deoxy-8-phosphooctulonate synthase [Candidatus Pelagibacter sp.]|jgi:2-dehydro-3-deoxyphosphooctonate aldolase (KDO 8-P synthase)|nr:3-deoxy-8-phosphooctulonate synthase [Candidatus Pelagibacter sp.]
MKKLQVIAGNCVLESLETSIKTSSFLREMSEKFNFDLIYKSSYKKDNRSSTDYFSTLGNQECAEIFSELKNKDYKIITDVHNIYELDLELFKFIDIIQIPAYLCMQTELTTAMAKTGKSINLKKGQFLSPSDVEKIVMKIKSAGNDKITITERGTCFGYRDLVVDPRSFLILKNLNYPVFFDVGHSVRKNGFPSSDTTKGGQKEYGETYARSAISNFIDGLFIEVHPDPKNAKCDAATQFSFNEFENLMTNVKPLWDFVNTKTK